ncbi:MAG: TIGR03943 family protein [Chloroflexi bacterium]|nr:MAG: TIGR03943 family protein [Chloroflexota bacterium]
MTPRMTRASRGLVLLALGVLILQRIWAGTLVWFVNPRTLALTWMAALGLIAMAGSLLDVRQLRRIAVGAGDGSNPATGLQAGDHELHQDHSGHDHTGHDHAAAGGYYSLVVLALPLIMALLVPSKPLDGGAVANKGLNTARPLVRDAVTTLKRTEKPPEQRNILEWVRNFNYAADASVYAGQSADVTGFTYFDTRLAPGQFIVARYSISCCVADAMALGMVVQSDQAAPVGNAWIRVRGPVSLVKIGDQPMPLIKAVSVDGIGAPADPYLYP